MPPTRWGCFWDLGCSFLVGRFQSLLILYFLDSCHRWEVGTLRVRERDHPTGRSEQQKTTCYLHPFQQTFSKVEHTFQQTSVLLITCSPVPHIFESNLCSMCMYFQREISEQNQIFGLQPLRWLNANVFGLPSSPPYSSAPALPSVQGDRLLPKDSGILFTAWWKQFGGEKKKKGRTI